MKRQHALVFSLLLLPFVYILYLVFTDALGSDPAKTLVQLLGIWAIRCLVLVLAVSPLKQLTGWRHLLRFRRMLGLYVLFYASLHVLAYFLFLLDWHDIWADFTKRPYIILGATAFIMLIPLGITSTNKMMKRLGSNWKRLHQLVYPIAVLVVLHFFWLTRSDYGEPLLYGVVLGSLLGFRLYNKIHA